MLTALTGNWAVLSLKSESVSWQWLFLFQTWLNHHGYSWRTYNLDSSKLGSEFRLWKETFSHWFLYIYIACYKCNIDSLFFYMCKFLSHTLLTSYMKPGCKVTATQVPHRVVAWMCIYSVGMHKWINVCILDSNVLLSLFYTDETAATRTQKTHQ